MRIYDCCMFFQELDMLETRFHILSDAVDYFVVCEAEETHSGNPKPLNVLANWDRFRPWWNKLIYVNAGTLSDGQRNSWERERFHRSKIAEGLVSAQANDWIVVADCDEIPNPDVLLHIKDNAHLQCAKLELDFYYYDLQHRVKQGWAIGAYRRWIHNDPNDIRVCKGYSPYPFDRGGWHFSYFGGAQAIVEKVEAFMHHADPVVRDLPRDPMYVESLIGSGYDLYRRDNMIIEHVALSDSLPRYILDHIDEYRRMGWCE